MGTKKSSWFFVIKEFIIIIFIILFLRIFIFESHYVPSSSMKPTMQVGDFVIGTKYNYGYSKYSIPFFPNWFEGRFLDFNQPKRGDIITFYKEDKGIRLVKRIIGMPGDTVQMKNNTLYINKLPVDIQRLHIKNEQENNSQSIDNANTSNSNSISSNENKIDSSSNNLVINDELINTNSAYLQINKTDKYKYYLETLPNGVKYTIRYLINNIDENSILVDTEEFVVPYGEYFVMGDNRDRSADSRTGFFVRYDEIISKPTFVLFSNSHNIANPGFSFSNIFKFLTSFRLNRFFTVYQ
ncbi:MAG: signal peptidase I [Rickettsiales bacterium]